MHMDKSNSLKCADTTEPLPPKELNTSLDGPRDEDLLLDEVPLECRSGSGRI